MPRRGQQRGRDGGLQRDSKDRRPCTTDSRSHDDTPKEGGARPLYKQAARARLHVTARGNAGLWYDKFCNGWKSDWAGFASESGKRDWIETIANVGRKGGCLKTVGDPQFLAETVRRVEELTKANSGETFRLATAWRFVTGLGRSHPVENGFVWHQTLGTPYLPGSSLKGLARAYARDWESVDDKQFNRIFGPEPRTELNVGSVIFLDALPVEPVALEADVMTPHYVSWYQGEKDAVAGDWHSPMPIPFLTVAPGQNFVFALLPRTSSETDRQDCATAMTLLRQALETLGAGAKTAVGYGQFVGEDAMVRTPSASAEAAASESAGKAGSTIRAGGEAIVYSEVVKVLELEGGKVLVEFHDGETEEVDINEVKPR